MKHCSVLLLLAMILAMLSACGSEQQTPAEEEPQEETKLIDRVEVYNKTGKLQRIDHYATDSVGQQTVDYVITYSYSDTGRLLQVKKEGAGLENTKYLESYFYNGDLLSSSSVVSMDGLESEEHTYKYDGTTLKKERIILVSQSTSGTSRSEENRVYDESGRVISAEGTDDTGYWKKEYEYGESGDLLTLTNYHSSDGKTYRAFEITTYTYAETGELSVEKTVDAITEKPENEIVYQYDDGNRLVSKETYLSEEHTEENLAAKYACEFDEEGKLLWEADIYNDGTGCRTAYEYDESGNQVKKTAITYYGTYESRTTETDTQYDTQNHPVYRTTTDFNGVVTVDLDCTYDYYESGSVRNITYFLVD